MFCSLLYFFSDVFLSTQSTFVGNTGSSLTIAFEHKNKTSNDPEKKNRWERFPLAGVQYQLVPPTISMENVSQEDGGLYTYADNTNVRVIIRRE